MIDRLVGLCFTFLVAAVAVYVAVRLIEAVASSLVLIVAIITGLAAVVFVARLLWDRYRNQW